MNKGGRIPEIVLVLNVANQPRTNTNGTANNVFPTFHSGDVATFVLPQQTTDLMGAIVTGYYRFLDQTNTPLMTETNPNELGLFTTWSTNAGCVNFSPKCGNLGLFSSVTASRYLSGQKIDQLLFTALSAFIRSNARFHDDTFVNGSLGTDLYPYFQDASLDPSCILPMSAVSQWKNFSFSIPLGSFQAGHSISLNASQGLQLDFQIARSYDSCHFLQADTPYPQYDSVKWPSAIYTGVADFGIGTAPWNIYTGLNNIPNSQAQYSIEAYLRMFVFLKPSNPAEPAADVFPYVTYTIRRTAMNYNSNQYFGFPLANNIISRFYWTALNKQNCLINPEVGQCHSAAMSLSDLRVFLNGSFQIYAYPTAGTPLLTQQSAFAPNALVYSSLIDDPVLFPSVATGGLQEYIYDSQGNGQVFADVILNYNLFLKPFGKGQWSTCTPTHTQPHHLALPLPWNPYFEGSSMIQSESFQDLNAMVSAYYSGQGGYNTSCYTKLSGDVSFLQSPLFKYLVSVPTNTDTDVTCITKEVKTLIVDATASTTISAAPIAEAVPTILHFNQCAGTSTVFRVQEVQVFGTRVPSATLNTITYQFLLPNSGTLGKMYLRFLPKYAKESYIPVGYGFYQTTNNIGATSNTVYTRVWGEYLFNNPNATVPIMTANSAMTYPTLQTISFPLTGLNTFSYNDMLGTGTWFRAHRWILPLSLNLQFNNMQEDFFLKYYGTSSKQLAAENYWTRHISDTYFTENSTEGFLVDFSFRQYSSAVPQHLSMFPWFILADLNTVFKERRDFPTGVLPICTVACNKLHESFTNMERICLSNEKQFVQFDFDTRMIAQGNCDAGLGYGLTNTGDAMRWRLGPGQSPYTNGYKGVPTTIDSLNDNLGGQGFRRRQTFGFEIDETYPPSLLIQLVYYDGETMTHMLQDMQTNGVVQNYLTFDAQRRRLELRDLVYPTAGKLDEINTNTVLNIAGRNPTHIFINHTPLLMRNNEFQMVRSDPTQPENYAAYYSDTGIYPGYIGRRSGPLMISLPSAVHSNALFNSSQQLVQTFNPTLDGSPLNPFNIGNNETNLINYSLCVGQPMLQPANVVQVNSPRRIKYFEMDPPLIGALCQPWMGTVVEMENNNCYNWNYAEQVLTAALPVFDIGGPVCAYQYRGANLLPTRFVVPLYIRSEFWNAAVLQVNATNFPTDLAPWNYTLGGIDQEYKLQTTPANWFSNLIRYNPFYDCHFLLRTYYFAQRLTLHFTTTTAQLSFDYPSGGTIVA